MSGMHQAVSAAPKARSEQEGEVREPGIPASTSPTSEQDYL